MKRTLAFLVAAFLVTSAVAAQPQAPAQPAAPVTAIRAGRLIDPDTGTAATNQIILVEGTRIRDIGTNLPIPAGANIIDLSDLNVLPGLVDAHNHLAMTNLPGTSLYTNYVLHSNGCPRDSGCLQRNPDAVVGLHDRA